MLLTLSLPRINDLMVNAKVTAIHAGVGSLLVPGAALMDLCVDLSAVAPHDCPPVSYYRFVLRDRAILRTLAATTGDDVAVGALLAVFSTEPAEPLDGEISRPVRTSIAGIITDTESW